MILAFAAMTFADWSDPFEDDGTNGESTSTGETNNGAQVPKLAF